MTADDANVIDHRRAICLCRAAGRDCRYVATVAVAADGTEHLVLASRADLGHGSVQYDPTCSDVAPHEQTGPLSARWLARVIVAPLRCGHRTKTTGRPCRRPVPHPGAACRWHRGEAP